MAFPTSVNSQITDALTQGSVQVLGSAPATASAALYQVLAHAVGMAMQNAVAHQHSANALASAVTTRCVGALLGDGRGH